MTYLDAIRRVTPHVAGLVTLTLVLGCHDALAESPASYRLAAISDEAYGHAVVAGDYDEAIARLQSKAERRLPGFSVHNNLCVALVASGRLTAAAEACDQAVKNGYRLVKLNRDAPLHLRRDYAMALSNRGVLRALDGALDQARTDFEKAVRQRARLDEPSENLARLEAVAGSGAAAS